MAAVVRDLVAATKRWEKAGETDWNQLGDIQNDAEAAMEIKSRPSRRRAALTLKDGKLMLNWQDRGVKVTIKDLDRGETRIYEA